MALAAVTHALAPSRLDCCSACYIGLPLKPAWELYLVENTATGFLMSVLDSYGSVWIVIYVKQDFSGILNTFLYQFTSGLFLAEQKN